MKKEKRSEQMRKLIRQHVGKFYACRAKNDFIPGQTPIPYAGRIFDDKELKNLVDASLDFWLTTGRYAQEFEKSLAAFLGVKYCLLANSGSSANLLALSALTSPLLKKKRLKPGDEVITTACGFPTTLNPIVQNQLVPVFVDVGLGTYNIKAEQIEKAITKKTKAILIAHTLGNPANLGAILKIVRKYNLWLIEDNCDALGSRYRDQQTGTFGHLSTCSFYPAHHITMGEGGAVLTNDPLLKKIVLSFRDWGRDCWCDPGSDDTCRRRFSQKCGALPYGYDHKYVYSHIGYNLKVTDMQAAIGCAQIKKLPSFIKARQRNFDYLYRQLSQYEKYLLLPEPEKLSCPSWFGFPLLVKTSAPFSRADIVRYLESKKIATRMLFGGNLIKQPAYQGIKYKVCGPLDNTDLVLERLFWIGVYPGLTQDHLRYMTQTFADFMHGYAVKG